MILTCHRDGVGEETYVETYGHLHVFYCRQEGFPIVSEINYARIYTGVIGFLNESDCIFVKWLLH